MGVTVSIVNNARSRRSAPKRGGDVGEESNAFRPKIAVVASPGVWDTRAVAWTGTVGTSWRDITEGVTVNGRGV